jgi:hypothetical protein
MPPRKQNLPELPPTAVSIEAIGSPSPASMRLGNAGASGCCWRLCHAIVMEEEFHT